MSAPQWLGIKTVVRCANFDRSLDFYTRILGFTIAEEWSEPQGRGAVFHVEGVGPCLEIYEMSREDARFDERFHRPLENDKIDLQLETRSVAEWARRLAGLWLLEGPEVLPWGQFWIKLRDPDRLLIAIYERK